MHTTTSFFVAILTGLLPCLAAAEPDFAGADAKDANDALLDLAAKSRAAALKMTWDHGAGRKSSNYGAFISGDGLALVALEAVSKGQKPTAVTSKGKSLKFGSILKIFPEQHLVLMKFDCRPDVFVSIATKEPEVDETIAFLPLGDPPGFGKVPPVVGPVLVRRSAQTSGLKEPGLVRVLSLGSGLSAEQRTSLSDGCFAIDGQGDLVAFAFALVPQFQQTLIELYSVAPLSGQIGGIPKNGKGLGFPLPPASNVIDPAIYEPDYRELRDAGMRRNQAAARGILKGLLERYPKSPTLQMAAIEPNLVGLGQLLLGLEDFPIPDPNDPNQAKLNFNYHARAMILLGRRNLQGAILELEAAVASCPEDFPLARATLADFYLAEQRPADAEKLYREAYPFMSDTIVFVSRFESLLIAQDKPGDTDKMSNRILDLEAIYRRR